MTEPASPAASPVTLPARRRPGHIGPIHVLQLLVAELAIVAVVASQTRSAPVALATAVITAVALIVTFGRRRHRWWLQDRLIHARFRRRTRPFAVDADDPRLAAMRRLAPGLALANVRASDGAEVGVARDDGGWYAAIGLRTDAPMRDDPGRRVPLEALLTTLGDAGQPGVVLQTIMHTVPAPSLVDALSPVGRSYRQLVDDTGALPTDAVTWIAIRIDARALALAGGDASRAPAAIAALVRRAAKALRRAGIPYRVLDASELLTALSRSCDVDGRPAEIREEWSRWQSYRLAHRTFWVRRWPTDGRAADLLRAMSMQDGSMTSVALTLTPGTRPDSETVDLRGLIRVAAPHDMLDDVCRVLRRKAADRRADLFPLDGEHGPAVYASAPTGGGPR